MLLNTPVRLGYAGAIMNAIISTALNIKTLIPYHYHSRVPFVKSVSEQICTGILGFYRRGCAIG